MKSKLEKLLERGTITKVFFNGGWNWRFIPNNTNEMGVFRVTTNEGLDQLVEDCFENCSFLYI